MTVPSTNVSATPTRKLSTRAVMTPKTGAISTVK